MVLFAVHDLLKDSPFSRLDLVSCRNLLIYLNREAQRRALEIFHFALRPAGLLFLGASETVDGSEHLFQPVDKKHRIYEPRPVARASACRCRASQSTLARALELQERSRDGHVPRPRPAAPVPAVGATQRSPADARRRLVARAAPEADRALRAAVGGRHRRVRDRPPVRARRPLPAHSRRRAEHQPAAASVDPLLAVELRAALLRAVDSKAAVETVAAAVRRRRHAGRASSCASPRPRTWRRASCSSPSTCAPSTRRQPSGADAPKTRTSGACSSRSTS